MRKRISIFLTFIAILSVGIGSLKTYKCYETGKLTSQIALVDEDVEAYSQWWEWVPIIAPIIGEILEDDDPVHYTKGSKRCTKLVDGKEKTGTQETCVKQNGDGTSECNPGDGFPGPCIVN